MSLFKDGKNVFFDPDGERKLSKDAYHFIAGLLTHVKGMTAITNPLVNSYKRLVPGYEAPCYLAWSASNRSALIRIPAARGQSTRVELRNPDPSCNPYLALAACLAAGLDGIERELEPPAEITENIFEMNETQRAACGIEDLPDSLEHALDSLQADPLMAEVLGPHIYAQFIAGKKQTQEEFFHTFNTLYESGRQIVLTSDRPPREMTQLEDRLQSRFVSGLMVDVAPPDFETRLAIIKNKAAMLGVKLPDEIYGYIAENVTANVRQIEGTLNKLLAYRDLLGDQVDEQSVGRAVRDMLQKSNEYIPSPSVIISYICKYFSVEEDVLRGQRRGRNEVNARQIAMYLIRRMTNLSLNDIGKEFGDRDHTTVLHSLDKVEKQMRTDPAFAEVVKEITTNINAKR